MRPFKRQLKGAQSLRGAIGVEELYALSLVSLNQGSSVQLMQEKLLRRHGILWRHLHVEIVRAPHSLAPARLPCTAPG